MKNTETHSWFAWYPIYTDEGKWAWLRTVNRRWVQRPDVWGCVDLSGYVYSTEDETWNYR